jgi:hypothetical protein
MNSKKTIADVKAGRIYRCNHCDKKCDDEYYTAAYPPDACYLGRVDNSKTIIRYFCTVKCRDYVYLQETLPQIARLLPQYKENLERRKEVYKEYLSCGPTEPLPPDVWEEFKHALLCITHSIKFMEACLSRKSEYELHSLKLKAIHVHGPLIEDLHQEIQDMNDVLRMRLFIDNLDCSALCSQKIEMFCVVVVEDIKANQTMNSKMHESEEEEEEMESFDENKKYICWKCNRDFTDECDDRTSFEKKKERMYMCMSCHSDEDEEEEKKN